MGRYNFRCHDCSTLFVKLGSMHKPPKMSVCKVCESQEIYRDFGGVHISTFKPYVDRETTGDPIELTSFKQRDKLLADNNSTMDSHRYVPRKRKRKSWKDRINKEEILRELSQGYKAPPEEKKQRRDLDMSETVLVN